MATSDVNSTKPSFGDKMVNNYEGLSAGFSALNTGFSAIAGERSEFSGKEGALAKSLDSTYDTIQDTVSQFGPYGKLVSLGMGVNKLVGNIAGKLGGGTDGMTKIDSILGSPFFQMTPFGLINGFGGKKSDTFAKDNELFSTMGSSYGGASDMADDALAVSGKKYGAFSSGALSEANQAIAEAQRQQTIISRINTEAQTRQALQSSMAGTNYNGYSLAMQGGYDQSGVRIGRFGMVFEKNIQRAKDILKAKESEKRKSTNKPIIVTKKNRSLEELITYAKDQNPRFIQRLLEPPRGIKFKDDAGNLVQGSHYMMWGTDDNGNGIVYPRIQEINGELKFLSEDEAYKNAIKNKNFLVMTPEEADLFSKEYKKGFPKFFENFDSSIKEFKEGGTIGSIIKPIKPIFKTEEPVVQEFKEGGSFNVIPEGALHARKHNMDIEGITSKGIPVVSQAEGGEIEQQAEIERNEVILRLEVTKKLEELQEKYYSDDYTQKQKDEFAIEAGKLLTYELLQNTQDNTGLLNEV